MRRAGSTRTGRRPACCTNPDQRPSMDALDNTVAKDERVAACWRAFCAGIRLSPETPYQAWYFGDSPELAHDLAELVLNGPKRATAGLAWLFDDRPDLGPAVDGYSVITEFDGTPRAVIRTTGIERRAFRDVDADF